MAVEVWEFTSYGVPQVHQIVNHRQLPPVGNLTITMPAALARVYLIVDQSVEYNQSPNTTIELHPTFYQPDVESFTVSKPAAHPGDTLSLEWNSDSRFPLLIKASLIFETAERSWVEAAEQFDDLPASGTVTLTVPDSLANLVGMSFDLNYHNHDVTGYIKNVMVKVSRE